MSKLDDLFNKLEAQIASDISSKVSQTVEALEEITPKLTKYHSKQWFVTTGGERIVEDQPTRPKRGEEPRPFNSPLQSVKLQEFKSTYKKLENFTIYNHADYIYDLEFKGISKKAPPLFTYITLKQFWG